MRKVHIGFDDTDSREGMCTSYLASLVLEELLKEGIEPFDYPNLIRLNPNIPWKTRGNGAIALRLLCHKPHMVFETICNMVSRYSDLDNDANPGVAMLVSDSIPQTIREFSSLALRSTVRKRRAIGLALEEGITTHEEGNGMGIIGAISSIGNPLDGDHTYELLAYRSPSVKRRQRLVTPASVEEMARATHPFTFNCYDPEKKRVLITPHGPDPVVLGIRGESPEKVLEAFRALDIHEPLERYLIFRSNQGTSAHLSSRISLRAMRAFSSGHVEAKVSSRPFAGLGGHVFFRIANEEGEAVCAVYEPAGRFRKIALSLIPDDEVEIAGGIRRRGKRHPAAINVEYIKVLTLAPDVRLSNPRCTMCGRRTKSLGREKGFRCDRCEIEDVHSTKTRETLPRTLATELSLPPPRAQRHLTKPLHRYGMERKVALPLIPNWLSFRPSSFEVSPKLRYAP